jgi:hypothetical protein
MNLAEYGTEIKILRCKALQRLVSKKWIGTYYYPLMRIHEV